MRPFTVYRFKARQLDVHYFFLTHVIQMNGVASVREIRRNVISTCWPPLASCRLQYNIHLPSSTASTPYTRASCSNHVHIL